MKPSSSSGSSSSTPGRLSPLVNEDGASIYSASESARNEFPDLDITVRGAISIGRRLQDPLAELVKIDPQSIGVGQYQHDVDQAGPGTNSLDEVIASCVNGVLGVELNSASVELLSHVSGLGPSPCRKHCQLEKQQGARSGPAVNYLKFHGWVRRPSNWQQVSCGFATAVTPLDNTGVHPERYALVETIAADLGCTLESLITSKELRDSIRIESYVSRDIGRPNA